MPELVHGLRARGLGSPCVPVMVLNNIVCLPCSGIHAAASWFLLCALRQRRTADLSTGKDAALRVAVSLGR